MSVNAVSNADSLFALLSHGGKRASGTSSMGGSASFALYLANLQAQTMGTLTGAGSGPNATSGLSALLATLHGSASASGTPSIGANASLSDPAAAFGMMSFINRQDVDFKAQYAELGQMGSYVSGLQQAGNGLAGINATAADASIEARLQAFVGQYNDWVKRFDADMQSGGILADTRAAQVSRYELAQSIQNRFNGVADGFNGLADLGVSLDATTGLATLDSAKLDAALASNRQGVVDTLRQFGAGFAKSAQLLDASGNFIANRLDNLGRAIGYLRDNLPSLQAEFGTGAAAKPSAQVAQALAAYNQIYGLS